MFEIIGGKSKYVSLLSLIKRESSKLYDIISDLHLDGMFRTQKYQNTFLMPSKELVLQLEQFIDNDNDLKAIEIIRSLMLKGHLTKDDFKKGATIGTLQSGSMVLAEPEEVKKHIVDYNKNVITTKDGSHATIVFQYNGSEFPKVVGGKSGGVVLVGKSAFGGKDENAEKIKEITLTLIDSKNHKKTVDNFFKAVAGILIILQDTDKARFIRAKYYLASNPVLSWFFLTMPGSNHGLIKASDLKDFKWEVVTDLSIIMTAQEDEYTVDKEILRSVKAQRLTLINDKGDRSQLIPGIKECYKSIADKMLRSKSIDSTLHNNITLKMLMDEIRFIHEESIQSMEQLDDMLSDVGAIVWSNPERHQVICDESIYETSSRVKNKEAFICGPVAFVKSIYFNYIPLNDSIETQLLKSTMIGGASGVADPSTIHNITFSGGAARKQLKKSMDVSLESIVKMMSKAQRDSLKAML